MDAPAYHPALQTSTASDPSDESDNRDDGTGELAETPDVIDYKIKWIHFILGCAVLLPWNALITATPYFLSRLTGSPLRSTFSSYLSTSFTAVNFVVLAHATATAKKASSSYRIFGGTSWLAILVLLLTLSTYTAPSPGLFFTFIILNGAAQATAGSYLQTAVVAIASLFGPPAMQAVMSGQAAVGVVVSGVQVLSALASISASRAAAAAAVPYDEGKAEARAAFLFFALSTLFLISTLGAHAWLVRMPSYQAVVAPLERAKLREGDAGEREGLIGGAPADVGAGDEKGTIWRVAKANVVYEVAVAYVFIVTLAVFPPITTSIAPTNPETHPLLFNAIHFLLFNIGDFTGRNLCAFPRLQIWAPSKLLALSLARTFFIPLFLMCNVQRPSPLSDTATPVINSDLLFFLILLAFGLSNGYVSSLCMMAAPSLAHNPRLGGRRTDVDVAATIAGFCLVGGLAVGSAASFAVRGVVCGCNPFKE